MVVKVDLEFSAKDAMKAVNRRDLIIVIDVLRSSTTIVNALANGVKSIIPAETLKEAYNLRRQHPDYLLVGERRGHKPEGFDFGNSPLEFTSQLVLGRNMILTTTSGTKALIRCRHARWVFIGAFLNAQSTAKKTIETAENEGMNVSFVLAGEKGRFSLEDFICAGAIAARFPDDKVNLSDKTLAALLAYKQVASSLCENIMNAAHARHLIELGFKGDIEFSCQLNRFNIVPIFRDGKVTRFK